MEIIKIIGKFQKCGILSSLLICEFLKICWDIFENLELWHSFASWLYEEMIKIVKSVWNGKRKEKKKGNSDEKWKPVWRERYP